MFEQAGEYWHWTAIVECDYPKNGSIDIHSLLGALRQRLKGREFSGGLSLEDNPRAEFFFGVNGLTAEIAKATAEDLFTTALGATGVSGLTIERLEVVADRPEPVDRQQIAPVIYMANFKRGR